MWHVYSFEDAKKEKKNYARTSYRHECEPFIPMFNIASYVVTWGVMPLVGGGLFEDANISRSVYIDNHLRSCVCFQLISLISSYCGRFQLPLKKKDSVLESLITSRSILYLKIATDF
jgi:hypothetical protein